MSDIIFKNGNIRTLDQRFPIVDCLLVKGSKIEAIGSWKSAKSLIRPHTKIIDLAGKTVVPGLTDCHVHLVQVGFTEDSIKLRGMGDLGEVFDSIRAATKVIPAGEWILATLLAYDTLKENRYPTLKEMDQVAPQHPLWIRTTSGHACLTNSLALEKMGISRDIEVLKPSFSDGRFTGLFPTSTAARYVRKQIVTSLSDLRVEQHIRLAVDQSIKNGLSTVHALVGGDFEDDRDIKILYQIQEDLPVKIVIYHQSFEVERVAESGLPRIGGCLHLDGSTGERTAAYFEPYEDDHTTKGLLYNSDDKINEFISHAHCLGLQTSMHAIGDRAIEQLIKAHENANRKIPYLDARHRIEHCQLPSKDQLRRAKDIGLVISVQPILPYYNYFNEGASFVARLGAERSRRYLPLRWMLDHELLICGGTDSPVRPLSPMRNIHAAVNHHNPEQRLTPGEALELVTVNGAKAAFLENETGLLRVGMAADMTILDNDLLTCSEDKIQDINVWATVVDGKIHIN